MLQIKGLRYSDLGHFKCTAINRFGMISQTKELRKLGNYFLPNTHYLVLIFSILFLLLRYPDQAMSGGNNISNTNFLGGIVGKVR